MSEDHAVAIDYTPAVVAFPCVCGAQLTIHRHSIGSSLSGCFCQKCDEQYFIRWNEGIVRRGPIGEALRDANTERISLPPPFFDMSKRSNVNWADTVGYRPSITDVHERTKAGEQ